MRSAHPFGPKKDKGVNYPWLTHEIKKLMQQGDWFLKRVRRTNKESAYRTPRNAVNKKVRLAKADYNRNLIKTLMLKNYSGEL